ncbi:MAG TPA: cation diffusion facilitator family transporter [Bacillales bacterium]|nr:cation diffusion facilitator family transporter [Bacillales bacterium]
MIGHQEERTLIGKRVAWLALISNIILAVGKIVVGFFGHSEAVFADGIHSGADVVASIAVLAVVGIANKPPDADHPFGHGKAEVISEGIVGIILFLVSVYIVVEAVMAFLGKPEVPDWIAMYAALISFASKLFLYRYSMEKGIRYRNKAIIAIAYDHKGDIVASLAASIGVVFAILGEIFNLYYLLYADAVASLIVAVLIFKFSAKLTGSSVNVLMEKNVEQEKLKKYLSIIRDYNEVKRIDQIRARDHGHYILLDLRLSFDYDLTIKQGHDIAREIKKEIQHQYPEVEEVFIHINPYFEDEE